MIYYKTYHCHSYSNGLVSTLWYITRRITVIAIVMSWWVNYDIYGIYGIYDIWYIWGEGCYLRVVPLGNFLEGQAHPNLSSNQVFLFFWRFFVFAFRWLRVFHWGCYVYFRIVFSSNSLYILYIFIFIYFIYFFIVLIVDLLIIPLRFVFLVFAVVSLWHPGVGRDVRKKPLPYNYFFTSLF